ncbi:MAG: carboxypeptidase-like regulatory domain-containing protein, partial [Bacteroidetes bacterium]|nr:carboxypeptidase-like regulatory domain-containing protein [Bacteroidota bacterium]
MRYVSSFARLVILVALVGFPLSALAQSTGKITGTVIDDTGAPLPGAQVVIDGTTTGTITLADGFYSINNVRPGTYALVFRFVGFATV